MPVFSAFGFIADDAAQKFALDQLRQFVELLSGRLSLEAKGYLPFHGMDPLSKSVYLAADSDNPDTGLQVAYEARPMALKTTVILSDRAALQKALNGAEENAAAWLEALTSLDNSWQFRLQQMEFDPEAGTAQHYKDVFKDSISELNEEAMVEILAKATYLNGEDKWLAPIYLTRRTPADFVAAMGRSVVDVMATDIDNLLPVIRLLGTSRKARTTTKRATRPTRVKPAPVIAAALEKPEELGERFTHVSTLKSLHLRRGFINMTPAHWPFFAINSRTTTREVKVHFDDKVDKKSTVWRLVPDDRARLVLGKSAHEWLEQTFDVDDAVELIAVKSDEDAIDIQLRPAE